MTNEQDLLLVSAHLDSAGCAPGADDNGSANIDPAAASVDRPTERWSALQRRIALLRQRAAAAAAVQQSLGLSQWDMALDRFGQFIDASLELRDGNEIAIDARILTVESQLDQLVPPTIKGIARGDQKVTHHCVTACKVHGYGIFSAHDNKEDARFNAALTGGKADYVERTEGQERVLPGPALREALRLASEYC